MSKQTKNLSLINFWLLKIDHNYRIYNKKLLMTKSYKVMRNIMMIYLKHSHTNIYNYHHPSFVYTIKY